jgi:hypothetical protein
MIGTTHGQQRRTLILRHATGHVAGSTQDLSQTWQIQRSPSALLSRIGRMKYGDNRSYPANLIPALSDLAIRAGCAISSRP